MSQENVEVVKAFFDAYNARDSEAMDRLLHPDAKMTTLSARGGLGGHWRRGTTERYFEQLDQAWADFRIEVEHYRELGQRVVALGVARGAGMSSHVEVASDFAVVFIVMDSQILLLDTYDDWKAGLEAAGLREEAMSQQESIELVRRAYDSFNQWAAHPERRPLADTSLLHPEVEFHTYATSPEAGVYRGPDAVIEYNQRLFEQFESVRIEVQEVVPAGDRVIVTSRQHAVPRGGQTAMVVDVVEVWTIREGLLAVRQSFATRAEALEAVGLRE